MVRIVDLIERSQSTRERGTLRKIIKEVIEKDNKNNNLDRIMDLDRTIRQKLIHVANSTQWDKTCCCIVICL